MTRRLAREWVFHILFQVDIGHIPWQEALERTIINYAPDEKTRFYLREMVEGTQGKVTEIDNIITELSVEWPPARMAGTDRNILRLATYELLYRPDIPIEVSINEAVELAKKYGEEDSGRFVNGILGSLVKKLQTDDDTKQKIELQEGKTPNEGG